MVLRREGYDMGIRLMNRYIDRIVKDCRRNRREYLIPKSINRFKYINGVEVGVAKGKHALNILKKSPGIYLYLIDNYCENEPGYKGISGKDRYREALDNLREHIDNGRCELIKGDSVEISKRFEDNSIDICYIDADHSYEGIKRDVEAWIGKVKIGGILCGHDYKNIRKCGVKKYIDEYIKVSGYKLRVMGGAGSGWLFIKDH